MVQAVQEEMTLDQGSMSLLCFGAPGVGKTRIATILAHEFTSNQSAQDRTLSIQEISGAAVTASQVKDWLTDLKYQNPPDKWSVIIINELDRIPDQAQVLMLDYLDKLSGRRAVIASSNEDLQTMAKRFTSRFQQIPIEPIAIEDIKTLLKSKWPAIPAKRREEIAHCSQGDIRAALLDAQTHLDSIRFS